ncbi:PhaM family polyhydroxyalkanoate granule multifunctional regulatory protein [Denitratisoma sp. DHT3]|uniref:PhaM family polyhydroxyalkanoate granule multifunctional regulatory protein n=1 Tax=Denitratisoma sp. DHT3 TaxID=1981880 RepID=UPI0021BCFF8A|nr:PhaM family polyhydroxyalkanoate granule multifunctional regulatory protein [Denitratisoma sp. DHT3]
MSDASMDPMEFLKNLWGNVGVPLPGMSVPTMDTGELDKRIADLRAVEGWLKMNLNMLQMSIQALEVQRATLNAIQAMSQSGMSPGTGTGTESNPNPLGTFGNAALWPWNFMPQTQSDSAPPTEPAPKPGKPDQAR